MHLIINDEALLRRPCERVELGEGRELARRLVAWMEKNNKKAYKPMRPEERKIDSQGRTHPRPSRPTPALGVAAPQFGVTKRVAVARPCGRPIVLVNPRVVARSESQVPWTEGCLSFPGKEVETYRRVWVEVACDNWPATQRFGPASPDNWGHESLLESVCVQHEVAHLAGLLFFDFLGHDAPDPLHWFDRGGASG